MGGHFLRADNGNYYATAGKGFHGISRVEGLDSYKVQTSPLRVTADQTKFAQQLRPVLKGRSDAVGYANGKETRKELLAPELAKRTKNFKLDGELEDWGARHKFNNIGEAKDRLVFDAAQDERGLFVAVSGEGKVDGKVDDWRQAYRADFAFDLQFRTNAKSRARDSVAGDRRLIIARQGTEWVAVLYEYEGDGVVLNSPVATTKVGKITKQPADAVKVVMKEDQLALDTNLGDALDGVGETPTMPGSDAKPKKPLGRPWTAELQLPWPTLGLAATDAYRFDIGVLLGARARYWSNRYVPPAGDAALETMLNPGAWGTLRFR